MIEGERNMCTVNSPHSFDVIDGEPYKKDGDGLRSYLFIFCHKCGVSREILVRDLNKKTE